MFGWNAAFYVYQCKFVTIDFVALYVRLGFNGLLVVSAIEQFNITALTVSVFGLQLNTIAAPKHVGRSGILIYYYDQPVAEYIKTPRATVIIKNFKFYFNTLFKAHQNALSILLTQVHYNVTIVVSDCSFCNSQNFTLFNYYGESCGMNIKNSLELRNLKVYNNSGDVLVLIAVHNHGLNTAETKQICDRHYNNINVTKSMFYNNTINNTLLSVVPINTLSTNVRLTITHSE